MVWISIVRPPQSRQEEFLKKAVKSGPNHGRAGTTQKGYLEADIVKKEGWNIVKAEKELGKGKKCFHDAKQMILNLKNYQLGWVTVETDTPVKQYQAFCNCVRVLLPWVTNPLQVEYVDHEVPAPKGGRTCAVGTSTLEGHVLSGEERFQIHWDNKGDDTVKYEIYSFSKPANLLGWVGYPIIYGLQAQFVKQSLNTVYNGVQDKVQD